MKINLDTIESRIDSFMERTASGPRPHLGVSTLGHKCDRKIWIMHRWGVIEKFSGRMLRLFARGQNEEPVMAKYLRSAGLDIRKTGFDQVKVSFGAHVSGSIDGVILSGIPEAPAKLHLWENKTASEKSFNDLVKNGIEKSKPEHWCQIQGYLLGTFDPEFKAAYGFGNIDRALYTVVNKNTDEIYTERVKFDRARAEAIIERGKKIALSDRMPEPMNADPTWWECKFCPALDLCKGSRVTKEANCRTCAHATAEPNGDWTCAIHPESGPIPLDFQRVGCRAHTIHPDLVPWEMKEGVGNSAVYTIDGKEIINGEDGIDSRKLVGPSALAGNQQEPEEVVEWPVGIRKSEEAE